MAHESFEDKTTANLMNDYFINIKVDRRETRFRFYISKFFSTF